MDASKPITVLLCEFVSRFGSLSFRVGVEEGSREGTPGPPDSRGQHASSGAAAPASRFHPQGCRFADLSSNNPTQKRVCKHTARIDTDVIGNAMRKWGCKRAARIDTDVTGDAIRKWGCKCAARIDTDVTGNAMRKWGCKHTARIDTDVTGNAMRKWGCKGRLAP